jgi:hypothetical protein
MNSPNIFPSREVRWFFSGADTSTWGRWFDDNFKGYVKNERRRYDRYLIFPGIDFAGVKLREYEPDPKNRKTLNLEFKLRESPPLAESFLDGVTGMVESWRKWSDEVETSEAGFIEASGVAKGTWRTVTKDRKVARYRAFDDKVQLMPANTSPKEIPSGCTVEFTRLGDDSGTFGFETFGNESKYDLGTILKRTVGDTFKKAPPKVLADHISFGYPRWINSAQYDPGAGLLRLVLQLIDAENNGGEKGREQADGILAPNFTYITRAIGKEQNREQLLNAIDASNPDVLRQVDESETWVSGSDTSKVIKTLVTTATRSNPENITGRFRNLHVFDNQQGQWRCMAWHVTKVE